MRSTLSFQDIGSALCAIEQGKPDWQNALPKKLDAESTEVLDALILFAQRRMLVRSLVDSSPEIIWLQGSDGADQYLNPAWMRFTGMSLEQSIGDGWTQALHPDDHDTCLKTFIEAVRTKVPNIGECRFLSHEDAYHSFAYISTPVFDAEGHICNWVGLNTDITDIKLLAKKLTVLQGELAHVNRLGLMGEMATGFANALNQPLTAMINYAKGSIRRIKMGFSQQEQIAEAMLAVTREAERTQTLIERLRNFVGKGSTESIYCDIPEIIRDAVLFFDREQIQHWIHIDVQLPSNLKSVYAPRIHLLQIVVKLLSQAIEAVRESNLERRQLNVKLWSPDPEHIAIVIRDRRPQSTQRMCAPAILADTEGLLEGHHGLSVTYAIIHSIGGYLESSFDVQGHIYRLILPAVEQFVTEEHAGNQAYKQVGARVT